MIRQFVSLMLAAAIVMSADAKPLRRRRRAVDLAKFETPCPVTCGWSFSNAWAKAISFEIPTANMIPARLIAGKNDTFSVMCALYQGYSSCLRDCAEDNSDDIAAVNASPPYAEVCTNRQTEYNTYTPCLSNNSKLFQSSCKRENENLLAATVRLNTQRKFDAPVRDFCRVANDQAFCVLPIVRQKCGDGPYDSIRSIINASLVSMRVSVPSDMIDAFYPECAVYFETIENGIDTPIASENRTASLTTSASTSTTTNSTSFRRDDVNETTISDSKSEPAADFSITPRPRNPATTSSHGVVIRFNNVFTFFTALFSVFLFL